MLPIQRLPQQLDISRVAKDVSNICAIDFPNWEKWFG